MTFLSKIHNFIFLTVFILRNEIKWNKLKMSLIFLKLCLRWFFSDFLKIRFTSENFLGYHVKIFDYAQFHQMFCDIFIEKVYAFKTPKKKPFVIDCGSNIGMSVLFFKYLYSKSEIVAFEPDPKAFAALQQNIKNNKLDVKVEQVALADKEGTTEFFTPADEEGSWSATAIRGMRKNQSWRTKRVKVKKLSHYIKQSVDLLKIDVEGAELHILRDLATQKKLIYVKQIILEYHYNLQNAENKLSELTKIFEENNFSFEIRTSLLTQNVQPDPGRGYNLLIYALNNRSRIHRS